MENNKPVRPNRIKDLTGQMFERLEVIELEKRHGREYYWYCYCHCGLGNFVIRLGSRISSGGVRSCGCLSRETTSKIRKGSKHSEKSKQLIKDKRKLQSPPNKGVKFSEEHVINISTAAKLVSDTYKIENGKHWNSGRERSEKSKQLNRDHHLGKKASAATRAKMSESGGKMLGYKHTDLTRRIISEKRLLQVFPTKDTEPERILQEALRKFIEIETHFPIKGQPDIKIGNILIFVDGDYYHAYPGKYRPEDKIIGGKTAQQIWDKDKRITEYLQSKSYTVLRFWEHDIHNNLEEIVNGIEEKINGR